MKPRGTRRLTAEQRRASILQHAVGQVGAWGFKSVSMRDIAREADINEALIYRHFPSKRALLEAVVAKIREERPISPRQVPAGKDEFFSALRRFEAFFMSANAPDATPLKVILYAVLEGYPLPDEFDPDREGTFLHWMRACIQRGKSAWGFSRDVDPASAAAVFMGGLIYHGIQGYLTRSTRPPRAGACTRILQRALEERRRVPPRGGA